ncbi:MAG: hypothetical protein N4A50_10230 [Vallitalea sp.]|jgi:hypothetical protein|nr:hypothetical protein [Vallitalea sp.]
MACNNINSCSGVANAVIGGSSNSVQYGYSNKNIEFNSIGTFTIWEAVDLEDLSGTVVIEPQRLPAEIQISFNGANTTTITVTSDIFSTSIEPLSKVDITTTTSLRTRIKASVIATGFN